MRRATKHMLFDHSRSHTPFFNIAILDIFLLVMLLGQRAHSICVLKGCGFCPMSIDRCTLASVCSYLNIFAVGIFASFQNIWCGNLPSAFLPNFIIELYTCINIIFILFSIRISGIRRFNMQTFRIEIYFRLKIESVIRVENFQNMKNTEIFSYFLYEKIHKRC